MKKINLQSSQNIYGEKTKLLFTNKTLQINKLVHLRMWTSTDTKVLLLFFCLNDKTILHH